MIQAIPVNISPPSPLVKVGDRFTIQGVRILPSGRFITNCARGEETELVNSKRPSIFKLTAPEVSGR